MGVVGGSRVKVGERKVVGGRRGKKGRGKWLEGRDWREVGEGVEGRGRSGVGECGRG